MSVEKLYHHYKITMLTEKEEKALFLELRNLQKSNNLKEVNKLQTKLLLQFKPVVFAAVNKLSGYSINKSDLFSEAYMALALAINSFDITHGARFSSYSYRCVLLTLYTYITKNYFMVNPCRDKKHKKLFFRLRGYFREEIQRTGKTCCDIDFFERVANELNTSIDVVKSMITLMNNPYESTSRAVNNETGDDLTLGDIIVDDAPMADEILQNKKLVALHKNIIDDGLNELDERTQDIIRSQVLAEDKITLTVLGERYGISRERVRQIRQSGLHRLEKYIRSSIRRKNLELVDIIPD